VHTVLVEDPGAVWQSLPLAARERVDAALRRRHTLHSIMIILEESDMAVGLVVAQAIAWERSRSLARLGEVEPEPVMTLDELLAKVAEIPDRIVAIEAVWDGETDGWFVELLAIVERTSRHHHRFDQVVLAFLRRGGDIRLFNDQVPPWPEAVEATQHGQALAMSVGVPFYFFDPQTPNLDQPRWWDRADVSQGGADV
jgi:hypothetical protein